MVITPPPLTVGDESIWKRCLAATERVIVLLWLGALHFGVEKGIEWRLHAYPMLLKFLDVFVVAAFSVIYVTIVLDMVAVFIPRFRVPNPFESKAFSELKK